MSASWFSPNFAIGHIRIGSVQGASCVNMGNNFPTNFQSQKKHNQGFGEISGSRNHISGARAFLDDSDFMDSLSGEGADLIPETVRQWFSELVKDAAMKASAES